MVRTIDTKHTWWGTENQRDDGVSSNLYILHGTKNVNIAASQLCSLDGSINQGVQPRTAAETQKTIDIETRGVGKAK